MQRTATRRLAARVLLPLALFSLSAAAADLDHNDPDRTALLDAARGSEAERFVVKDMRKDGDFAYLCALKQDKDGINGTDEAIDVYTWGFYRYQGSWRALALSGSTFAESTDKVDCSLEGKAITTAAQIRTAIAGNFAADVRDELHQGLSLATQERLKQLTQLGVLQTVDIEEAKNPYSDTQLQVVLQACHDDACRNANRQAYARLQQLQRAPGTSSLVWNRCVYGMRALNLTLNARCVEATAPLPVCRPHQRLPNDEKSIESCLASVEKQCRNDVTREQDHEMLCR
jgi:hypothetical protein